MLNDNNPRKPSHRLTFADAVEIWLAVWRGEFKQRIAARFDCNVGRVYEVLSGQLHRGSKKAAQEQYHGDSGEGDPPPPPIQPTLPL